MSDPVLESRQWEVAELLGERARIDALLRDTLEAQDAAAVALFGRNLKRLREAKGLSQQELSDLVGMARTGITNMEAGRQTTPWPNLVRLADALGVSLDEFRSDLA